jgi:TatD DNase family protein
MGLFDVHAHLTHARFSADLPAVLERARFAGVTSIISNGLNPGDNTAVLALAAREPLVRAAVGLYPVDAVLLEMRAAGVEYPREGDEWSAEEGIASVREHADQAFAIGEIGLDGHWVPERFWAQQEAVFRTLVQIALDANKPIILHSRKREQRAFEILKEMGVTAADWHCFGSKVKLARQIAEQGYYVSIPANARRNENFTRMLQKLPRERLLLETDCPYLSPEPGTRNDSSTVAATVQLAAELWSVTREAALHQFEQNYQGLFGVAP